MSTEFIPAADAARAPFETATKPDEAGAKRAAAPILIQHLDIQGIAQYFVT